MHISFLHTGQVHVATFDALLEELGYNGNVSHRVEEGLLTDARASGLDAVADEAHAILQELSNSDAVLCTCSTIGPLADKFAKDHPNTLRIDRPAMALACQYGPKPLVAICLESTREPTLALIKRIGEELGLSISPKVVMCASAWPHFEDGNMEAFADQIASEVSKAVASDGDIDCVLLAQASMHVAHKKLNRLKVPVLTTPLPATQRLIETAREFTTRSG